MASCFLCRANPSRALSWADSPTSSAAGPHGDPNLLPPSPSTPLASPLQAAPGDGFNPYSSGKAATLLLLLHFFFPSKDRGEETFAISEPRTNSAFISRCSPWASCHQEGNVRARPRCLLQAGTKHPTAKRSWARPLRTEDIVNRGSKLQHGA